MPIYEYRCQSCGHELEAIQKISDEPLTDCPSCNQNTLKKRISAAGFRLKGGGWYETDFKSGSKRNVSSEGAGDSAANDSSTTKTSDSNVSSDSGSQTKPVSSGAASGSSGSSGSD